jgi:predicted transcriptional regulator
MRKAGPPRDIPPPLELECLKALWALGEGNVKDVRLRLTANRNLAYTTVLTVLDRLARKGGVARRKVGRSFVYAPVLSRDALRRLAVKELVDCFFDGSEDALRRYLQGSANGIAALHDEWTETRLDTTLL